MSRLPFAALALVLGVLAPEARRTIDTVKPSEYEAKVLAPHRGRILVVNFWATWCEPCREEMPALIAAGRKMASRDVSVVLVSADFLSDRDSKVRGFLDHARAPFPCFIEDSADPQTFIDRVDPKWGGELPHTVLYGRDGRMRLTLSKPLTEPELLRVLARGLAEW